MKEGAFCVANAALANVHSHMKFLTILTVCLFISSPAFAKPTKHKTEPTVTNRVLVSTSNGKTTVLGTMQTVKVCVAVAQALNLVTPTVVYDCVGG